MARVRLTFALPVAAAALIGGFIGGTVTRLGCAGPACSSLTVVVVSLASALVAGTGVGIVVVLADRSLREWRSEGSPRTDGSFGDDG